jgi:hypothetical protein
MKRILIDPEYEQCTIYYNNIFTIFKGDVDSMMTSLISILNMSGEPFEIVLDIHGIGMAYKDNLNSHGIDVTEIKYIPLSKFYI